MGNRGRVTPRHEWTGFTQDVREVTCALFRGVSDGKAGPISEGKGVERFILNVLQFPKLPKRQFGMKLGNLH